MSKATDKPLAFAKLEAITEPRFGPITLPDGTQREYDLYELAEKVQQAAADAGGSLAENAEGVRTAFGFPTLAERDGAAVAEGQPKPFTLSRAQAFTLQAAVLEALTELPASKKLSSLGQS